MVAPPSRTAIYARVSRDTDGTSLSPDAQVEQCLKVAGDLGWDPVVYVDRNLSAWDAATSRPAWNQLVEGIRDGTLDGVVIHHVDRLLRRVAQLEELIAVIEKRAGRGRFPIHSVHGELDLSTADGRFSARILTSVAQKESDDKSRRLKLVFDKAAREGRPHGGGKHPYGWKEDRVTVDPAEADLLRMVVDWVLNGVSLSEACRRLNATTPTRSGKPWVPGTLRTILRNPRLAGVRLHNGKKHPGAWDPIIDLATFDRLQAVFDARSDQYVGSARKHWVTGVLECGICGGRVWQSRMHQGVRRYLCKKERGGCGQTIRADELDAAVETVMFGLLEGGHLEGRGADREDRGNEVDLAVQRDELAALEGRLEKLSRDFYVDGAITELEFQAARAGLQERIDELDVLELTARHHRHQVAQLAEDIEVVWAGATAVERVEIAREVYRAVVIHRATPGLQSFDPTRVELWLHE